MKAIITVLGSDRPGIIAEVSAKLFEHNINILEISQTIMDSCFTMVMQVELSGMNLSFKAMQEELNSTAEKSHIEIRMQRYEIFEAMHRV